MALNNLKWKSAETSAAKRVLVLYTGGSIGMKKQSGLYAPIAKIFLKIIKTYPELHDKCYAKHLLNEEVPENVFVIPNVEEGVSLLYYIEEYEPLLDSSNMSMDDWKKIASDIGRNYEQYDGFVVLHGTDTMSYTASALSFMLEGLNKAVICTGSQRRSDGKSNFYDALIFASSIKGPLPEVCICFKRRLFRGNRSMKYSSSLLKAFISPNYPQLGSVDFDCKLNSTFVLSPESSSKSRFNVNVDLEHRIALLQLFPGISTELIEAVLGSCRGVILMSFGTGNVPTARANLMGALKKATSRGVLVVNVSQCLHGIVSTCYETAKELDEIGVVCGADMTPEAAIAKLSYVLGQSNWTPEQQKEAMATNLRGELTDTVHI